MVGVTEPAKARNPNHPIPSKGNAMSSPGIVAGSVAIAGRTAAHPTAAMAATSPTARSGRRRMSATEAKPSEATMPITSSDAVLNPPYPGESKDNPAACTRSCRNEPVPDDDDQTTTAVAPPTMALTQRPSIT